MTVAGMSPATVVPRPQEWSARPGTAVLVDGLVVSADEACDCVARLLAGELAAATGWAVHVRKVASAGGGPGADVPSGGAHHGNAMPGVHLEVGAGLAPEEYTLEVDGAGVRVTGGSPAGAFYGTRTLLQLLPPDILRSAPTGAVPELALEGTRVHDRPRFAWRGIGLDVSRHFMPKSFLLRLVDLAALHKLNVLHLHLTDDQGWRVEVDRYPLLTEVGAWRAESPLGHYNEHRTDGAPHGGFYTKDDLRELVSYAACRFVTVLPEIDMPGHMQAAIAAYPELGNTGEQLDVFTNWGISEHVLNMEAATLRFCADVLDEVMDVFPGHYVHIGGDECPTTEWEASAAATRRAQEGGLPGPAHLQGWFTARMAEVLASRGRALVGWDEVLDAGAPPGALIMVWRGEHARRAAVEAARTGHDVVMAPETLTYFDWAYTDAATEPVAIRPALSVEKAYGFEPIPEGLEPEHHVRIIGAQCQLWTEYVATPARAEYMYFPRACAFAEAVWCGPERDWPAFEQRLRRHLPRLDAIGVGYRPLEGPLPGQARTWLVPVPVTRRR